MKILFLSSSPLHKMHIVDMYIEEISSAFETLVWDVSPLFGGIGKTDFPQVPVISDMQEFENRLDDVVRQDKVAVITNILIFDLYVVYWQIHRRGIPIISIDKEMMITWMKDNYGKKHPDRVERRERNKYLIKAIHGDPGLDHPQHRYPQCVGCRACVRAQLPAQQVVGGDIEKFGELAYRLWVGCGLLTFPFSNSLRAHK